MTEQILATDIILSASALMVILPILLGAILAILFEPVRQILSESLGWIVEEIRWGLRRLLRVRVVNDLLTYLVGIRWG